MKRRRELDLPRCLVSVGLAGALTLLGAATAPAQEQAADDALGFADQVELQPSAPESAATDEPVSLGESEAEPANLSFGTTLWLQSALRVEQSGPYRLGGLKQIVQAALVYKRELGESAHLRLQLSGRSEVDFAYLLEKQAYDSATYDAYAWRLLPGESYLALYWPSFELSIGEQIVSFAEGEMLSLFDLVNPRDLRQPLLTEPSLVHLPVLMTKVGISLASVRAEVAVVHEPYFGLIAPPLGEFSPLRKLQLADAALGQAQRERALVNVHHPGRSIAQPSATQVHARLRYSGPGVDLSLLASSLLDGAGVPSLPEPAAFGASTIPVPIFHPRYTMVGHSGAWTIGPVLLRWEAAVDLGRSLLLSRRDSEFLIWSVARRSIVRGMLGITYALSGSTNAALEAQQSYVLDNPARDPSQDSAPLFPIELTQFAFRFQQLLFRERVRLSALALLIGVPEVNGWAARAELAYALQDRLELSVGYVTYQPSNEFGFFYGFERNDRAFLNLRWDSTL